MFDSDERAEHGDGVLLPAELAVGLAELELRLRRDRRRCRRSAATPRTRPRPPASAAGARSRGPAGRAVAACSAPRFVDRVGEELRLGPGEGLGLHRVPAPDQVDALALLDQIVELRRLELGGLVLGLALAYLVELRLDAGALVAQVLARRLDGVDARVDQELERREDDDDEDDVRRRAVPRTGAPRSSAGAWRST